MNRPFCNPILNIFHSEDDEQDENDEENNSEGPVDFEDIGKLSSIWDRLFES